MKWIYSLRSKFKIALVLGVVLVLVLAKSLMDSRNVNQLGASFTSVYEDRLLVESYLFQLSGHLYQKKMLVDNCLVSNSQGVFPVSIKERDLAMAALLQDFEKTKLTQAEAQHLQALKHSIQEIHALETRYWGAAAPGLENVTSKKLMDAQYLIAASHLNQLSNIQVAEGKRLNEESKQIIAGSAILTQFEMVLIIGLGVLIHILIFASKSQIPKFPQKPMLN